MLYVLTTAAGIAEIHEDAELMLPIGAVEITELQLSGLYDGTNTIVNGMVA